MGKGSFNSNPSMNLLYAIRDCWGNSSHPQARDRSQRLARILDKVSEDDLITGDWDSTMKCAPPDNCKPDLQKCLDRSKSNKKLYQAVIDCWDSARSWKTPSQLSDNFCKLLGRDDLLKDAMILGDKSCGAMIECDEMFIGLAYLEPGTVYPEHAHDATELYHALVGTALWGPTARHLRPVEPDNFVYHPSAISHYFDVPKDEIFIAIYCWIGHIPGVFWFKDERGLSVEHKYHDIYELENPNQVEKYYDNMAEDYTEVVRFWGYNMPETIFTTLVDHAGFTKDKKFNILDLGCGDGLCGNIINYRGYQNGTLTGLDISSKMLAKAAERNDYSSLVKGDLFHKLPFPDDFYNYVICVGVTTYVDPRRLYDWVRVIKPGGYILLTNKTEVLPQWNAVQDKLVTRKILKHVFSSEDLFYLPCCPKEDLATRVRVQLYQKCTI